MPGVPALIITCPLCPSMMALSTSSTSATDHATSRAARNALSLNSCISTSYCQLVTPPYTTGCSAYVLFLRFSLLLSRLHARRAAAGGLALLVCSRGPRAGLQRALRHI